MRVFGPAKSSVSLRNNSLGGRRNRKRQFALLAAVRIGLVTLSPLEPSHPVALRGGTGHWPVAAGDSPASATIRPETELGGIS